MKMSAGDGFLSEAWLKRNLLPSSSGFGSSSFLMDCWNEVSKAIFFPEATISSLPHGPSQIGSLLFQNQQGREPLLLRCMFNCMYCNYVYIIMYIVLLSLYSMG